MKVYTDIEQSRKLAEILPIESADGFYEAQINVIPCLSLAALLEIIRNNGRYELQIYEGGYYLEANGFMTESYFNPTDACYDMIIKLHEQKRL